MTVAADIERHPGLRLMQATAAALRAAPPAPADALGGAFLEQEAPDALAADAAASALARIDALAAVDARATEAADRAGRQLTELVGLPDPLRERVFEAIDRGGRWQFLSFGIRALKLPQVGGEGVTELFRIEPGAGVAEHDHEGDEYTLVITGAFHDGHRRYGPGDVNIGSPGFRHGPKAEPGEVCYALAVSLGRPRFGFPVNVMHRLLGG